MLDYEPDKYPSIYDYCVSKTSSAEGENPQELLLRCISKTLQDSNRDIGNGMNTFFLLYASSLVFFMQAGFAMLCAGCVRFKNVQNTMLKNLLDTCGAALGFYSIGYALAFGGHELMASHGHEINSKQKTFIGTQNFFLVGVENYALFVFEFAFAASTTTIIAGTLAERCQMAAYLCYSLIFTAFVYPVIAHAAWTDQGFLSPYADNPLLGTGFIDFAGSGVVHTAGGITALFASFILGPRKGRFYDMRGKRLEKPRPMPGHSMALQVLGTLTLWFGWYGFNAGSAITISSTEQGRVAATAAVNTTLAGAAGGIMGLVAKLIITEKMTGEGRFDLVTTMNGCLSGLVSITGGCAIMEPWSAVMVGSISALLYIYTSELLIKNCIDDAVDAIPVHLTGGVIGILSVGLFASPSKLQMAYGNSRHVGWFFSWGRGSGDATLLACQICGLLFIIGWVFAIMFPFFCAINYMGWFRSDALTEVVGLDLSYHGGDGDNKIENKVELLNSHIKRKSNITTESERRGSHAQSTATGRRSVPAPSSTKSRIEHAIEDLENTSVDRIVSRV